MTHIDFDFERDRFVVTGTLAVNDRMTSVPGARWSKKDNAWLVYPGLPQVFALSELPDITATDDAKALKKELAPKVGSWFKGKTYDARLYPFQQDGVAFLLANRNSLLADEMGTGKTVQTLMVMSWTGSAHLVVCTKSMMHKWAAEVRTWYPDAEPVIIEGKPQQRIAKINEYMALQDAGHDVVGIINYDAMKLHTSLAGFGSTRVAGVDAQDKELNALSFDTLVLDEAHKIKDPRSKVTRAAWRLGRQAAARYALTGTPLVNNPDDIWSVLHFLDPQEWPSRSAFRDRYCTMYANPHGGYENLGLRPDRQPEFTEIMKRRMIRRTKAEVLPDLPSKRHEVIWLPMDQAQATNYAKLRDEMILALDEGLLVVTDPLVLAGKLRMAACATPLLSAVTGEVSGLRAPSNKVEALLELVDEMAGQPLVVFAESRKLVEYARAALPASVRAGMITGAIDPAERAANVSAFQSGHLDVMLCTTGAGAEGITLTAADTLVFLQQSWSNVANKQAEDRIHRIGQERPVRIITLISEGTIESAVYSVTQEKEDRLQQVVRDPEWLRRNL